jgi:nucleoid DNA-binding protein
MNIDELVTQAKATAGKQLSDIPDAKAKALVRHVFGEIVKIIDAGHSEPVRVAGLGVFRTNTVEREKEGIKSSVTRTFFKPAITKPK